MTQFITIGQNASQRSIAVDIRAGTGTPVVWLSGFLSEMASTKGEAVAQWAADNNRPLIRLDYSGHGQSGGDYTRHTISEWLEEALAVITRFANAPPVLAGSSMGGWLAVLATLALRREGAACAPRGLVLLAPAIDFTERLVWGRMPEPARHVLMETGQFIVPSSYAERPYHFTRTFIEDGRSHCVMGRDLTLGCPVHILYGMEDADVPFDLVRDFSGQLAHDPVTFTTIPDGDHRLSRESDIAMLTRAIGALSSLQRHGRKVVFPGIGNGGAFRIGQHDRLTTGG